MKTGQDLIAQAESHLGDKYVYGADVDLGNSNWPGPWDCAELVTYDVLRVTGKIYGALDPDSDNPDPWTGKWASDVKAGRVIRIPRKQAAVTPGAILLRYRPGGHHIVFAVGDGRTLGAQNSRDGVAYGQVGNLDSWDWGILIPGVEYKGVDS